jgi:hypothetical protein
MPERFAISPLVPVGWAATRADVPAEIWDFRSTEDELASRVTQLGSFGLLLADHEKNGVICGWLEPL